MSSQNAICLASSDGQNTFAFSATRQSCKSVWRFLHQSTSSLRLWISKLVSCSLASPGFSCYHFTNFSFFSCPIVQDLGKISSRNQTAKERALEVKGWSQGCWKGGSSFQETKFTQSRLQHRHQVGWTKESSTRHHCSWCWSNWSKY